MKKNIILTVLLLLLVGHSYGQQASHGFEKIISSPVWDMIAELKFKTLSDTEYYPVFGERLQRLNNKTVTLEGYLIPTVGGIQHDTFMLATLPLNQCYFCGKNGIPIMIEVKMQEAIAFTYDPIRLKGVIGLNNGNAAENVPIVLSNGILLTK